MKWLFKKRILLPLLLVLIYFMGPKPKFPKYDNQLPQLAYNISNVESTISAKEVATPNIKPDNESRIIWADSAGSKTEYSVIYLHGFSASPMEGDPVHRDFARRYGANLYIPRLAGHGIEDDDSFADLTPKKLIDSAKEALAIGKLLGEKVVVLSCSTGGTLSAYLAAELSDEIEALFMYSPNIDLYDSAKSKLLTMPWGLQIARMLPGGHYHFVNIPDKFKQYWTHTYRKEGLIALRALLDETMTENTFQKITCPVFVGYYYKNEEEQDKTVSVAAMKMFSTKIATPKKKKKAIAFPNAQGHVMISGMRGNDLSDINKESYRFAEEVVGMTPVPETVSAN